MIEITWYTIGMVSQPTAIVNTVAKSYKPKHEHTYEHIQTLTDSLMQQTPNTRLALLVHGPPTPAIRLWLCSAHPPPPIVFYFIYWLGWRRLATIL